MGYFMNRSVAVVPKDGHPVIPLLPWWVSRKNPMQADVLVDLWESFFLRDILGYKWI